MPTRVLLVDDDAVVLSTLKAVFQTRGYAVTTAHSGRAAKETLAHAEFELVVTDMKMESDTAGFQVAQAAHSQPHQPAVIILTAFPLLAAEWRQAGAHAVLLKPANINESGGSWMNCCLLADVLHTDDVAFGAENWQSAVFLKIRRAARSGPYGVLWVLR